MGFRIEAPKQDGNARFNTLKVNLNENNLATRVVVVDEEGKFYYGSGGGGGTGGTNGTSGANGSSGTSGTGFNTISNPQLGRVLLSDGSTNSAIASTNLNFLNNTLQVTGSLIADSLLINSDVFEFTGSLRVLGGITGSLQGTSSWAINALTASSADSFIVRSDKFEFTGSLEVLGGITGSLLGTSSYALTASHALNVQGTASWAYNALTASSADDFYIRADKFEFTGSLEVLGGITGSLLGTASYAVTASHALNVVGTASWAYNALTASSADDFYIRADKFEFTGSLEVDGGITGSLLGTASYAITASHALNVVGTASWAYNALTASSADDFLVRGTLTAQTIVAQVITSSTQYITGSTIFGSQLSNTHQFTGSVYITGSLTTDDLTVLADNFEFTGSLEVLGGITGSLLGTSSYAITASHALNVVGTASWAYNALTASSADDFYIRADKFEFTGSLEVNGGITGSLYGTSSWAVSASWSPGSTQSDTASYVSSSNVYGPYGFDSIQTASFAFTASSADSFIVRSDKFEFTGSLEVLGFITSSGDLFIRSTTSEPITIGRGFYSASNDNNIVFGHASLVNAVSSSDRNIAIGDYALNTLVSGIENVAIGYGALRYAINNRNTAVGAYALFYTTGSTGFRNNAFGAYALAFNTTGEVNNAFGSYALYRNTVDDYNAAFGDFGLFNLSTGSSNAALGQAAGYNLRSGEGNVIIGRGAAPSLLSGSNNTIIGAITPSADINTPVFGLLTGSYNTIIGSNIKGLSSILDNNIIIADGQGTIRAWHNAISWSFSGSVVAPQGFTGSLQGTSSWAINALTASSADNFYVRSDKFEFTGSLEVLGGITGSLYGTASWAVSASWTPASIQSDTASFVTASNVWGPFGSNSIRSASYAATASSADSFIVRSDKFEFTGSLEVLGGITGSLLGTASFATTASYALNAGSTFPFSGSAVITGSLLISGSGLSTQFISNANNPLYIYTFNDPSNSTYGRLRFYYDSIQHRITSEGAGGASRDLGLMGGGAGGQLYLGTGGTNRWYITGTFNALGSGHFLPVGDNLYNIGDPTARVANYYGVGSYISNLLNVTGSANISGSVIITGSLNLNGTATVTTLVETSTRTLKENIQNYSIDLEKFKNLNPVTFNWKDTKKEDIGLIAEELENLFPEFVSKDDTGNPIGIQYGKLGIIFINVIKEQQKRIELLENQVKQLIK